MNRLNKQSSIFFLVLAASLLWLSTSTAKGPSEKVTVTDANPNAALQGEALDVVISGSGFGHGAKVKFLVTGTKDASQIDVGTVDFDEATGTLVATISVRDSALVDQYDIEVRASSGRRAKGTTLFAVKSKSGGGNITAECIVFAGDLESVLGSEVVEGCCPNAGPWPAYSMILHLLDADGTASTYAGQYDGQLFMNGGPAHGRRAPDDQYKVQFWSWDSDTEIPGVGDVFFEINGGDVVEDKKNKTLTVTFTDEQPTLWLYDHWVDDVCCAIEAPVSPVSFELVKTSDLTDCE